MRMEPWREIARFGRKMVEQGLVGSHFGNISVREGERIHITRTGSMLDEITEEEVVIVPLKGESSMDPLASTELRVHRRIYALTEHRAVVHGHTPYAVILSLKCDSVKPVDAEGGYFLGEIPVVEGESGSEELAANVASVLKDHRAVIVRGHGTFAAGQDLKEAFVALSAAEHSCRVLYGLLCLRA